MPDPDADSRGQAAAAGAPRDVSAAAAIQPRAMLGLLGGGQLGRMFVHAAQAAGFRVTVLETEPASPAAMAADAQLCAAYADPAALDALAAACAAITTEFENVPAAALERLALTIAAVAPSAAAVQVCQHRAREKAAFTAAGVACVPHVAIESAADLSAVLAQAVASPAVLLPGILKTSCLGYDGKGQRQVDTAADLPGAWAALGSVPCVLEQRVPLAQEISVVLARGHDGATVHLPVQQNLHRQGVLAVTQVPAPDVNAALQAQAVALATRMAAALHYVGVLCVEFFVLADGTLLANEMAPRPHNSGHYSIDACDLSQFDLQLRTLARLPLVPPRLHSPAVMLNLLGDLWFAGREPVPDEAPRQPDWSAALALPGVHLHLYGKATPRRGRKMGHLTVTAASAAQARSVALQAASSVGLPGF